ncbi:hypothetical protein F4861DRAFT_543571 [Xylaria intraflava]|nr:hypothetical protein F4861DRAFT_543571 [Xylaria intraflava]
MSQFNDQTPGPGASTAGGNVQPQDQVQQTQELYVPPFNDTLRVTHRVFRPVINGYEDMQAKLAEYIARNDVAETNTADVPQTNGERQALVQRLFVAVYDHQNTLEQPGSQHYRYIVNQDQYSEGEMHLMLWSLLKCIEEAQMGICTLPGWYTTEGPIYKSYPTFAERFGVVEGILKDSKSCCSSLFSSPNFAGRLAWNPTKEIKRKAVNHNLNQQKSAIQSLGMKYCRDKGLSRNANGEIQDEDGNTLEGQKSIIQTQVSTAMNATIKKRARPSERAQVTQKLVVHARSDQPVPEKMSETTGTQQMPQVHPPNPGLQPSQLLPPASIQTSQMLQPASIQPSQLLSPANIQSSQPFPPANIQPSQMLQPARTQPSQLLSPASIQPAQLLPPANIHPSQMLQRASIQQTSLGPPEHDPPNSALNDFFTPGLADSIMSTRLPEYQVDASGQLQLQDDHGFWNFALNESQSESQGPFGTDHANNGTQNQNPGQSNNGGFF